MSAICSCHNPVVTVTPLGEAYCTRCGFWYREGTFTHEPPERQPKTVKGYGGETWTDSRGVEYTRDLNGCVRRITPKI